MSDKDRQAPSDLIRDGQYSDLRYVEMMAGHHGLAAEMGKLAKDRAEHEELKEFAGKIVEDQSGQIETLQRIHDDLGGEGQIPTRPNPAERSMFGMRTLDELKASDQFDRDFIDTQLPHHASAIEMAAVAIKQSTRDDVRKLSHKIIDSQSKEIGKMIGWRHDWIGQMS